jgi:secreted trypsin-like serine protease
MRSRVFTAPAAPVCPRRLGGAACLLFALALLALALTAPVAEARIGGGATAHASVVGGQVAEPGTFPWMAFIIDFKGNEEEIACSGTVLAPNLVLTAAHCAVDLETGTPNEPSGYRVVTGNVDWASPERQVSGVSKMVVFPGYKVSKTSPIVFGDAALLVLSTPTTAPPIHLATAAQATRVRTGTHALIAGWGQTYYGQAEPTEWLMWAKTVVEGKRCEGLPGRICAIDFPKFKSGVCHGDSGGPLLEALPHGRGMIEIGITQAGFGECSTKRPSIFTRANLIAPWADRWIASLDPSS